MRMVLALTLQTVVGEALAAEASLAGTTPEQVATGWLQTLAMLRAARAGHEVCIDGLDTHRGPCWSVQIKAPTADHATDAYCDGGFEALGRALAEAVGKAAEIKREPEATE